MSASVERCLNQIIAANNERISKLWKLSIVGVRVSFSFLPVSVFMACALVSPLAGAGIIWALCVKRWRHAGKHAGTTGSILAAKFIAIYFVLHILFGNEVPIRPLSIAVAGGAGFTGGALMGVAWIWMKSRKA